MRFGTYSLFALSAFRETSAADNGYWCSMGREFDHSLRSSKLVSFRGIYRDFELFVEQSQNDLSGCKIFKDHSALSDGLWVIEEPNEDRLEQTKAKLLKAGLPIYFEEGFSLVVGGGSEVPNVSGLDGCGGDEYTSVMPVPAHSVRFPNVGASTLRKWEELPSSTNEFVAAGVAAVSEDSLISSVQTLQAFNSRNSYSDTIYGAQAFIAEKMQSLGFAIELMKFRADMAPNVVATWAHPSSTEWVVAGAHYDSRSENSSSTTARAPGADDNGSGTACMLEMGSIINSTAFPLSRGLKICFFTGEEQGLLGSQALASEWSAQGLDIVAMINADMLGYQAGEEITLGFKDRSVTPELVALAKDLTNLYVPGLPTADSSSCCSDYMSFYENGFASVGFFESGLAASAYPSYHKETDLLDNVNTKQLTLETQAVAATMLTLLL